MFDIGWLELMIIGIVALIVVGPKDLPGMFRTVGQFMGKARGMAREFQRTMEAAADESGLKEATDTMKGLNDPLAQAQKSMKDYSKNFVSQKDKTKVDAEAAAETAGEKLVREASEIASPAAKATAPKPAADGAVGEAASVKAPKKAAAKPKAKSTPKTTKTAAKSKTTKSKKTPAKAKAGEAKSG